MIFLLSSRNVVDYLSEHGLCETISQELSQIEAKSCKNFNLLVSLPNNRHLLIKQENHDGEGKTSGKFLKEWRIHEWLQKFSEISHIRSIISETIHYDSNNSILIFKYLNDYGDLDEFYSKERIFPTAIAQTIGTSIAAIHRTTLDNQQYKEFFAHKCEDIDKAPYFPRGVQRLRPGIFGQVSRENLKIFKLYQRHESLGNAIAELKTSFQPRCLTHNDLKLDNILLHNQWQQAVSKRDSSSAPTHLTNGQLKEDSIIRLIDWELFSWGDPAFDLGTIIASYLKIWLKSLVITTDIELETALRLATTPLELIQPSIVALTKAYFANFPEILAAFPDFLQRVMQFAGLTLIQRIHINIHYHETLGNRGICMLQVANTLLCYPEQSIAIVFGKTASELTDHSAIAA